jgi:Tol biopolymer transport system component
MESNDITEPAQAPIDAPSSTGAQPQAKPARRGCWRVLWIAVGSCLSLVALAVIGVLVLGAAGFLGGKSEHRNYEPTWSPDGTQIAFVSDRKGNTDIYVMNSDGSNVRQLTSNPFAELYFIFDNSVDYGPTWSPDSQRIAFISGRDNIMWGYVDSDIFIMDRDGRNVVKWEGSQLGREEKYPAWSPDGCCIVYSMSTDPGYLQTGALSIYVARVDSFGGTQLTADEAVNVTPAWSPDGKRIIFRSNRDDDFEFFVMNKDGSNLTQLTHMPDAIASPDWSKDGKRIAFISGKGKVDIYLMDADATHVVQLTHTTGNAYMPAWSPDGKRIAFVSDEGGVENIYVMDADGTNIVQLTH